MQTSTKEKIIEAAVLLFNENGLANVRLQQIADEAGISVGNLAYHFKNKEAIIIHVYESLFEEFSEILSSYLLQPNLLDFNDQLSKYFNFFHKYHFYLTDLFEIERSLPSVMEQWHQYVNKMMSQIKKRIEFNIKRNILVPEPNPNTYNLLANNIWMTIVFWTPQQILRGLPIEECKYKEAVWSQLLPYFTSVGQEEYLNTISPTIHSTQNGGRL